MGTSQNRAVWNHRNCLSDQGLSRFEVLGRAKDRDLIRSLARRLAENSPEAVQLRIVVSESISADPPKKGGILAALRRSPLVRGEIEITRSRDEGRSVDI